MAKTGMLLIGSFWILETAYFIVVYGWHKKAINEAEKICDDIVSGGIFICVVLAISVVFSFMEFFLSSVKLGKTEKFNVENGKQQAN